MVIFLSRRQDSPKGMAFPEPATYQTQIIKRLPFLVGAAGFEPATSCSQSRRDNRTTLRPELPKFFKNEVKIYTFVF